MSLTRRSLQVVAFIATLLVGAASMVVIVTQTTWFKEWLRGFIVRQAEDYVNGRLSIGRLDGNLFFGVDLDDVDVTMNGERVVDIDDLHLDYNAFTLFGGHVVLDEIRLTRPVLRLQRDEQGWNLARLIKVRTPDPDEPKNRRTLDIGQLAISDGTLYVEDGAVGTSGVDVPRRIENLDAAVGVSSDEDQLTVDIDRLELRAAEPNLRITRASGVIRRTPDELAFTDVRIRTEESSLRVDGTVRNVEGESPVVDMRAASDRLVVEEVARLVPRLRGYRLQPAFDVTATGPADRMQLDVGLREQRLGTIAADLTVDALAPTFRVSGTARVEQLNLEPLTRAEGGEPSRLASRITGNARFDLALPDDTQPLRGSYAVDADRVQVAGYDVRNVVADGRIDGPRVEVDARGDAYGGHATAAGIVRIAEPVSLDLTGHASNVDLRRLPPALGVPQVESDLQADYTLSSRAGAFRGTFALDRSTLAGASIAEGTTGTFAIGDGAPAYTAKGQVSGLDVQRVGREFRIDALAADRYRSEVNGTFDVSGSGGGRYPLSLDVTATLVDTRIFGATFPRMDVTTQLADGVARVRTVGTFSGLDPAVVTSNERVSGMLNGSVDANTVIRGYADGISVESLETAGRLELGPSTIGDIAIESASVDGSYANREGRLAELQVLGPDLNVAGQGTIALNETGQSNLTLHAETASLERIGEMLDRPLKGSAVVDATVTGNASELRAEGTLTGSNIGYGDSEALSLTSMFSAAVPELQFEQASVEAQSTATFLEVGGQRITELTAETTYSQSRLDFSAVAQEGPRELSAGGSLVLHPDHQEVHVTDLALRSEQIEWRLPAMAEAAVRYGGDRLEIDNLELVSGDQRIAADGVIGSGTETLQVRAENVDVAQLDTLLLGDGRLAGRLTGTATVSGPMDGLRVASDFTLSPGAFRTFMFDAVTGTVTYSNSGIVMDVRLEQTPTAWITATGTAPMTLFRPTPPEVDRSAGGGGPVDIQITSSAIDLGVIQGFTPYLTNVTGSLQANIRIAGTGYDPHAEGVIDVRGGAFEIPELGTNYTGLDTRVEIGPDLVTVQEFKILDNRGFPMTVGGTLAVRDRAVGAVDISLTSENFEVIDNELADLKLDTQLKITGELLRPRIVGTVDVENGTIHVAQLLDRVTTSPYDTGGLDTPDVGADEAARATPPAGEQPEETDEQPPLPLFDALALDITLQVPSNLVLRGNDLRPANAPIDFGDMNATVGGEVRIRKDPAMPLRLTGDVNTVRGTYTFQGRRFEIVRDGRIRFAGTDEIDPTLDVRARRVISGVETFVRVLGTLRQPELTFSSNPPLDQADILSLIVFNQPINELGEGQQVSLTDRAAALAGGYLATGLSRSISNALELDEFEIQTGEGGFNPTLSVGEQVGEHFFFRVRQGFGEAQATELILEYQITDYLRAQATAADTSQTERVTFRRVERAGLDLIFFFSY